MKTSFCLVLVLIASTILSQNLSNNFILNDDKTIKWQYIHESDIGFDEILEAIKGKGYFENINEGDGYIICDFKPYEIPYEKYGYTTMNAPIYISRNVVSASLKFELKEGRYRVTIKNILLTQNVDDNFSQMGEQHSFEWWVLNKKSEIKNNFFDPGSNIMNQDFLIKTLFKKTENDDNW
ncbi:MAG: hypothetical protein JXB17_07920 [Bacteroidales bacterium]|nr:hypothetical protein [Bacteroidales bacterium]